MHSKLSWYFALIFAMIQQQATGRWPLKCTRSQGRRSLVNCCSMATTTTTTTIRTTIWATMWGNNNKQLHENCQRLMFIGIRNRPSSFQLVHTHKHTHTQMWERDMHNPCPMPSEKQAVTLPQQQQQQQRAEELRDAANDSWITFIFNGDKCQ